MFAPEFEVLKEIHYEKTDAGIYESIKRDILYDHLDTSNRYGIILAKFRKLN
jgi:hypothetical protein